MKSDVPLKCARLSGPEITILLISLWTLISLPACSNETNEHTVKIMLVILQCGFPAKFVFCFVLKYSCACVRARARARTHTHPHAHTHTHTYTPACLVPPLLLWVIYKASPKPNLYFSLPIPITCNTCHNCCHPIRNHHNSRDILMFLSPNFTEEFRLGR